MRKFKTPDELAEWTKKKAYELGMKRYEEVKKRLTEHSQATSPRKTVSGTKGTKSKIAGRADPVKAADKIKGNLTGEWMRRRVHMKARVPKNTGQLELADRRKRPVFRKSIRGLRKSGKITPH